jgi:hypothetical protein
VRREPRGPTLLIIASVLSLFAIISFTVDEFREKAERQDAILRERSALRAQDVRLIQERARLDSRQEREVQDRADLRGQFNTIIQSLQRIEKAVQSH